MSAVTTALLSRLRDDALQFEADGDSVRQRFNQQQVELTLGNLLCILAFLSINNMGVENR